MANHLYGHSSASLYGVKGVLSSLYGSGDRSAAKESYVPPSSSLLSSSRYYSYSSDPQLASDPEAIGASAYSAYVASRLQASASWAAGIGAAANYSGTKRSSEAFYEPSSLGAHNTIGNAEDWLSTNFLAKRPRFESSSTLPIYPQRPGEKDCTYYMLTRTCKFGESCKFDHPIWVPEGGIPGWNEVPQTPVESFPERPGEPDCPYFLKTQTCKFGTKCKYNHPKDKLVSLVTPEEVDSSMYPERPSEPPCSFYIKTGKCKFGSNCKFHHPKDIDVSSTGNESGKGEQIDIFKPEGSVGDGRNQPPAFAPILCYNSKGLPIRLGEADCPFYMKTGSCKYGATCRYSHPDKDGPSGFASPGLNVGLVDPAAAILHGLDARLAQTMLGLGPTIYPQRPGEIECDHYMKTGECRFGLKCRFHHPIDRSNHQNIELTLAGLPRREGASHCAFYMKTGTCKFGVNCKFDHPPPGEVMAAATAAASEKSSAEGKGHSEVQ